MDRRRARDYRPVSPADQPAPAALVGRRTFQPSRAALRPGRVLISPVDSLDRPPPASTPAAAHSNRARRSVASARYHRSSDIPPLGSSKFYRRGRQRGRSWPADRWFAAPFSAARRRNAPRQLSIPDRAVRAAKSLSPSQAQPPQLSPSTPLRAHSVPIPDWSTLI